MPEPMRGKIEYRGGVLLRLPSLRIVPALEWSGRNFVAKREFHVTLLNRATAEHSGGESIARAVSGVNFEVRLLDEIWLVEEGSAAAIVRMCEVEGAAALYRALAVDRPPLHVTLYLSGTVRGIGLATSADLERLGTRLTAADCDTLLRLVRESPQ